MPIVAKSLLVRAAERKFAQSQARSRFNDSGINKGGSVQSESTVVLSQGYSVFSGGGGDEPKHRELRFGGGYCLQI